MSTTTKRKSGCGGCGGQARAHDRNGNGNGNGNGNDCGCRSAQPCGCEEHKPREVLGDCTCEGPVRCGVPCLERPAYSAGQLLTADSLRLGQRYFEDKFALRRYVDGVGIVCGLHVRCDPDAAGWVIVDPGYAIDCCGNDIVLCEPVRFNLCKAIDSCPTQAPPCDEVDETKAADVTVPDTSEAEFKPNISYQSQNTTSVIMGHIKDATTKAAIPGAIVKLTDAAGKEWTSTTPTDGVYRLGFNGPGLNAGNAEMHVSASGYRGAFCHLAIARATMYGIDVELEAAVPTTPVSESRALRDYVLRIEGAWEGRQPVPVVTSRAGCDPRPECKPSKQAATARLCVSPAEELSTTTQVDDRNRRFQELGKELEERLELTLELAANLTVDQQTDPNPVGRTVADTFLAMLREQPAISSCNLYDAICDVRRMITGDTPKCFTFPPQTQKDPEIALIGIFGRMLDDMRESYLRLGCDDCCDQIGVRLAHVFTEDLLPGCTGNGCSINIIDSHPPSRETLHPRTHWWVADHVIVYDAYFRFTEEACVLLKSRGLNVRYGGETDDGPFSSHVAESIKTWISRHGADGELKRLGLYEHSILYADCDDTVVLWTVRNRVVAITTDIIKAASKMVFQRKENLAAYARYSIMPRITAPALRTNVENNLNNPNEVPIHAAKLDPAPFRELLRGVGDKKELGLYKRGITTLDKLVATPDMVLAETFHPRDVEYIKSQARDILAGKTTFTRDELMQWGAAAAQRKASLERTPS